MSGTVLDVVRQMTLGTIAASKDGPSNAKIAVFASKLQAR